MNSSLRQYRFPKPVGSATEFAWDGCQFVNSVGERRKVLCYTQTESNWSEALTQLHEQEAGSQHPIDKASRRLAIRTIAELCKASDPLILDVGCSSGFLLEELAVKMPHAAVMGADYIEQPLQNVASQTKGIPLLQFDLRHCPLPEDSIDGIICLNVLEHIDDHAAALGNMLRILKPGGIVHIEVPSGPWLYDLYDEVLLHHRRYRIADIVVLARQVGFNVVQTTHLGFLAFPAFVLRKLWNRRRSGYALELKKHLVASQIRTTSDSRVLKILFGLETALGRRFRFPWGIRCVLVLQKPANENAALPTKDSPSLS
jgi:2-polyprenyl-3-methyl-5-hydroxy-6-metoxy-1,4-benzoquinol methylase